MKVSERIAVADRIAAEIAGRYDMVTAEVFLRAFIAGFRVDHSDFYSTKDMVTWALSDADEGVLGEMIDDLGIAAMSVESAKAQPPKIWQSKPQFRAFISHLSLEKDKATRLRDALASYGVSAFVAHEDIEPTLEWQVQIERALHSMELFISIHTKGFSQSVWAQQEVGFAVASGKKIIALRMGEDPMGFISKHQALSRGQKTAELIAQEIDQLLANDERTKARYLSSKEQALSLDDDVPF